MRSSGGESVFDTVGEGEGERECDGKEDGNSSSDSTCDFDGGLVRPKSVVDKMDVEGAGFCNTCASFPLNASQFC